MTLQLTVGAVMSSPVVTTPRSTCFPEAVKLMSRKRIGNLVVIKDGEPIGILTEREILQYLSLFKTLPNKALDRIPLHKFEKLDSETSIIEAARLMIARKARLLVFEKNASGKDRLTGITTVSDILQAFAKTGRNPPLGNIVRHRVFTANAANSVLAAVKVMYKKRIGSVIIEKDGRPFGIFTERDLLNKVLAQNVDIEEKVGDYCSRPILTARLRLGAGMAANLMLTNNVKRLPLVLRGEIVGIVTARDLVEAFLKSATE